MRKKGRLPFSEISKIIRENKIYIDKRKIQPLDIDYEYGTITSQLCKMETKINEIIDYINKHEPTERD